MPTKDVLASVRNNSANRFPNDDKTLNVSNFLRALILSSQKYVQYIEFTLRTFEIYFRLEDIGELFLSARILQADEMAILEVLQQTLVRTEN